MDAKIVKRLRERKNGSVRQLARDLQLPHSLVADALAGRHEHIGRESEDRLRVALGLPTMPPPRRWCDLPLRDLAAAIRNRQPYGGPND